MKIKTIQLGALAFLASVVLFAANGGTALAHYVYNSGYTHYSSEDCVWARSEVSHGSGNGYSKSNIEAYFRGSAGGTYCADYLERPAGYLKVRQIFEAQLAPGWGYCKDTGWVYNSNTTSYFTVARTHSSKCGSTNYRTESQGWMLNGSWKGGTLFSPTHWL
jgi:hypothetical protein